MSMGGCGDDGWSGVSEVCGAPDGPKATIQAGIDAAAVGDTVVVAVGEYGENIHFNGNDIVLTSTNPGDWGVVEATVIQGDGTDSVVAFVTGETAACKITGFTIRGGFGAPVSSDLYFGGGIYCDNASPTIERNIITENYGPTEIEGEEVFSYGGGILCYDSDSKILGNIIVGNSATYGGGVCSLYGSPEICSNIIDDNQANLGGGVCLVGAGKLTNNTIVNNGASFAGNVYVEPYGGTVEEIKQNIISGSTEGGGIYYAIPAGHITYNDVYDNVGGNYVYSGDLTGVNGNISEDPLFIDPAGGDYHLQGGSLCINSGDPCHVYGDEDFDIDGDHRVMGHCIDMGADEVLRVWSSAGADQYFDVIEQVTLDGSGSFWPDPEGTKQYQWTQVEGAEVVLSDPQTCGPTFMPPVLGEYRFELVISDGVDTSMPDEVLVVVGNRSPVAVAINRAFSLDGPAVLDGSGSYDPDPVDVLTWQWQQTAGDAVDLHDADTAVAWFEGAAEGEYRFELTVSDGFDVDSCQVDILCMGVQVVEEDLTVSIDNYRDYRYPDISQRWSVYCSGSYCDYSWDIWAKGLGGDEHYGMSSIGTNIHPKVDGDIVVWFSSGDGLGDPWGHEPMNSRIVINHLLTHQQKVLRQWDWSSSYSYPAISGTKVVWVEHLGLDLDPPGYEANNWWNASFNISGADVSDLDNVVYFTVAENAGHHDPYPCDTYFYDVEGVLEISGDIVVWEGDGDIYGADISDLNNIVVFTICDAPGRQCDPGISGDLVVWTDQRYDEGDIYGADISDRNDIQVFGIVREAGCQQQPVISGEVIVFVDGSYSINGSYTGEIKLCRLIGGDHRPMVLSFNEPRYGTAPSIDGHHIVWQIPHGDFYETKIEGMTCQVILLDGDGPVENITTSRKYGTIHDAMIGSAAGDEIVVSPGVYHENVHFEDRNIVLRSSHPNDPSVAAATVIQGDGTQSAVTFSGTENASCELRGLTITGGDAPLGGGVMGNFTVAQLRQCVIRGNHSAMAGGGVARFHGVVDRCIIRDNMAETYGGGMTGSKAELVHCVIANNVARQKGGGLYWYMGEIKHCTIVGNTVLEGEEDSKYGGGMWTCQTDSIRNCIIWGNSHPQMDSSPVPTYSCIEDGIAGGIGNLCVDPCFVDSANGDYHLKSEGWRWDAERKRWDYDDVTSRCIDAGNPGCGLGEELISIPEDPWNIFGENVRVNMGAYGGTAQASMGPWEWAMLGDLDNDGVVNLVDFHFQGSDWLMAGDEQAGDLNRDGVVDAADLGLLFDEWLGQAVWFME